jgi:superfamily II DNA or RNA helicase
MVLAMKRDLQYRGMRDDRMISFELKQDANYLLQTRVERAVDDIEYERLRQELDTVNRPARKDFVWSPEQREALHIVRQGIGMDDEEARLSSKRFLFISGDPGSGKTAVLLHMALEACPQISVLIVCPTGFLVHK